MYPFLEKNYTLFFIGGKTLYEQFIPLCERVWVTRIKGDYACDLFIDYDFSRDFDAEIYEEDDELQIVAYTRR